MLTPRAIMKLTPSDADAIHAQALAGDRSAAREYVWYSLWRKIDRERDIPKKDRVMAFKAARAAMIINVIENG